MPVLFADESSEFELLWGLLGLLSIPALVTLNGLFVAAEFSLVAVRRTRVEEMIARGITRARSVLTAVDQITRTIAATQLGITLSSIALGWVSESILARDLETVFGGLSWPWNMIARHSVAIALSFIGITFVHVVFGELIPKAMALQSPSRIALWLAPPLNLFTLLTRPVIILMSGTGAMILRLFGFRSELESHLHSVEELALLVEDTEEAGLIAPEQAELVQNVFELKNKQVRDCMVPRDKMAALELTMAPEKVLEAVRQGAHTAHAGIRRRCGQHRRHRQHEEPVFPVQPARRGGVGRRDVRPDLPQAGRGHRHRAELFRKAKRPMALVRDDHGKIFGVITLEDVIEEIVGDIEDEHDQPRPSRPSRRLRKLANRRRPGNPRLVCRNSKPIRRRKPRQHPTRGFEPTQSVIRAIPFPRSRPLEGWKPAAASPARPSRKHRLPGCAGRDLCLRVHPAVVLCPAQPGFHHHRHVAGCRLRDWLDSRNFT